jgi:hypothetical protein
VARAGTIGRICLPTAVLAAVLAAIPAVAGAAAPAPQAAYTQTNAAGANAIAWFARGSDGRLTQRAFVPTGGTGAPNYFSGFPNTDSQGSVALNPQKTLLFAVNHGSRSITSFRILPSGRPQRADIAASGGKGPASLAVNANGILYVVNEARPARLQGYRVTATGKLQPLGGPTTLRYPRSSPGQVGFDSTGRFLVVSARFGGAAKPDQDYFEVFRLRPDGRPQALPPVRSVPQEPYAFGFTSRNELLVANAENNTPLGSTTTSYRFGSGGGFTRVAAQPTSQTAGCWLVISDDDRFAYVSSGGAPTVVPYLMSAGGAFRNTPGGLIKLTGLGGDVAVTPGSAFLYALNTDPSGILARDPNAHSDIDGFRIRRDGRVTKIGTFGTGRLPFTSSGLAVL